LGVQTRVLAVFRVVKLVSAVLLFAQSLHCCSLVALLSVFRLSLSLSLSRERG
jgi:hypothetical protein